MFRLCWVVCLVCTAAGTILNVILKVYGILKNTKKDVMMAHRVFLIHAFTTSGTTYSSFDDLLYPSHFLSPSVQRTVCDVLPIGDLSSSFHSTPNVIEVCHFHQSSLHFTIFPIPIGFTHTSSQQYVARGTDL